MVGVDGDADELLDEVVGSVQQRKRNEIGSHKNWKNEKRKPFKLCLVKERYKLVYIIINHALIRLETLILRLHILWLLFILNNLLILRTTYIMVNYSY